MFAFVLQLDHGMPAQTPFTLTFDIDENGILRCKGVCGDTEKEITVQSAGRLSEDEIQKMTEDAERHAESDKKWAFAETAKKTYSLNLGAASL